MDKALLFKIGRHIIWKMCSKEEKCLQISWMVAFSLQEITFHLSCAVHTFPQKERGQWAFYYNFHQRFDNNGFSFFGLTKLVINLPRTYDMLSCHGKQYRSAISFSTNKQTDRERDRQTSCYFHIMIYLSIFPYLCICTVR